MKKLPIRRGWKIFMHMPFRSRSLLFVVIILVATACSDPGVVGDVKARLGSTDAVWLCDVDTSGRDVRYQTKELIASKTIATKFTPGQVLPVLGPSVKPGTDYGREAFVFLSGRPKVSANFILILRDGKLHDGTSREELTSLIKREANK